MQKNDEEVLRSTIKNIIHDLGPVLASFDFLVMPNMTDDERKSIAGDARATLKRLRDELKNAVDS